MKTEGNIITDWLEKYGDPENRKQVELEAFNLSFYTWLKENDTQENAEKWFGYSDEDMLNYYKEKVWNLL